MASSSMEESVEISMTGGSIQSNPDTEGEPHAAPLSLPLGDGPEADPAGADAADDNPFLSPLSTARLSTPGTASHSAYQARRFGSVSLADSECAGPGAAVHWHSGRTLTSLPLPDPMVSQEDRSLFWGVILLAASMLGTFGMYAPVQNVVTTLMPGTATASLALIYAFFTLGTLLAPTITRALGAPNVLIVACSGYLSYTVSCMTGDPFLFLLASIVVGLCASLLWTAQGAVLTEMSTPQNRGMHSSILIGAVRFAAVCSNLAMGWVLNSTTADGQLRFSSTQLFLFMLLIGCFGLAGFIMLRLKMVFLRPILQRREARARQAAEEEAAKQQAEALRQIDAADAAGVSTTDADATAESSGTDAESHAQQLQSVASTPSVPLTVATPFSLRARLLEIFRMIVDPDYRHLFPILFVAQGLGNGYFFGAFPVTMGRSYLGFAQSAMGCVAVSCIFGLGRLLDLIPRHLTHRKKWIVYITLGAHVLLYIFGSITTAYSDGYTSRMPDGDRPPIVSRGTYTFLVYATCLTFGVAYSGTDICQFYFLGALYPRQSETAFAAKAFAESLGFVLAQGLITILPARVYPILAAIWTLPVVWWFYKWKFPVEPMHSKKK